jgi:hypothetical protein
MRQKSTISSLRPKPTPILDIIVGLPLAKHQLSFSRDGSYSLGKGYGNSRTKSTVPVSSLIRVRVTSKVFPRSLDLKDPSLKPCIGACLRRTRKLGSVILRQCNRPYPSTTDAQRPASLSGTAHRNQRTALAPQQVRSILKS